MGTEKGEPRGALEYMISDLSLYTVVHLHLSEGLSDPDGPAASAFSLYSYSLQVCAREGGAL